MATIAKWVAALAPALWLGLLGASEGATSQSMVVVSCLHLESSNLEWEKSADVAFFRVSHQPFHNFVPGPKAQAQGVFLVSELVRTPATCDVNGKKAMIRVINYEPRVQGGGCESYQVEVWVDSALRFRSANPFPGACGIWGPISFEGTVEVNPSGYATVCSDDLHTVGHLPPPPLEGDKPIDQEATQYRLEHSSQPTEQDARLIYQRGCG